MYFCKRETILSSFFSKVMTEYRFILLSKFFHFADNTEYDEEAMPSKISCHSKIQFVLNKVYDKYI